MPSHDPEEESSILAAARSGDTAPLGEFLEAHRARLERVVAFRLDPRLRGRIDPADVVQETYVDVLRRLGEGVAGMDMGLFLWLRLEAGERLTSLHRAHLGTLARDAGREVPLLQKGLFGGSSFALASAILDASTPSRAAIREERARLLQEAVEGMKSVDREVLALRGFEQLTNKEVARLLDLSEPAATLRYVRALKRLRAVLDGLAIHWEASG